MKRRRGALSLVVAMAAAPPVMIAACGDSETTGGSSSLPSTTSDPQPDAGDFDVRVDGTSAGGGGMGGSGGLGGAGGVGGGVGGGGGGGGIGGSGGTAGAGGTGGAGGVPSCSIEQSFPPINDPAPAHVPTCSPIVWSSNPPSWGPHYGTWASYQTYTKPVPRGFYVHDLEHGGVVVLYNCPDGCDADVAAIQAFLDARPADPLCGAGGNRFVLTPDPLIDTRFAAAAWGFTLTGDCLDLPALGAFIDAHYNQGREAICGGGIDPTAADAGVPDDCGT